MSIDLDKKYTTPRDEGSISLGDEARDHGPRVLFRGNCGANGYYCAASFRDHEGYGGGTTPREALRSLAAGLRQLAARVEAAAAESPIEPLRVRMSAGMSKPEVTKKVRLADFGNVDEIEIKLELGSGSYGASVSYLEIDGVKRK